MSGAADSLSLSDSVPLAVLRLNISDSDMLTITDGDEVTTRILGRYVGGSSPFKLSSTTPDLTVTFHSDPAGLVFGKGEGFIINYMGESLMSYCGLIYLLPLDTRDWTFPDIDMPANIVFHLIALNMKSLL